MYFSTQHICFVFNLGYFCGTSAFISQLTVKRNKEREDQWSSGVRSTQSLYFKEYLISQITIYLLITHPVLIWTSEKIGSYMPLLWLKNPNLEKILDELKW